MSSTKTIAIVGATGKMGSVIARSLAEAKQHLVLVAINASKLTTLKQELRQINGSTVISLTNIKEAAWEADIVVLAVPTEVEMEVADTIKEVVAGKIVISISARNNRQEDVSAAEELQRKLPHAKVVKTFNSAFISTFVAPAVRCKTAEVFIAGNNGIAVGVVVDLAKSAGFNPLVIGDLTASRVLERMGTTGNR